MPPLDWSASPLMCRMKLGKPAAVSGGVQSKGVPGPVPKTGDIVVLSLNMLQTLPGARLNPSFTHSNWSCHLTRGALELVQDAGGQPGTIRRGLPRQADAELVGDDVGVGDQRDARAPGLNRDELPARPSWRWR